jgi:hypothetical protein
MTRLILLLPLLVCFGCQTPEAPTAPLEQEIIQPETVTPSTTAQPVTDDDWRLKGKEDLDEYFMGVTLVLRSFRPPPGEEWDHDHCKFCDAPFSMADAHLDPQKVGYVTENYCHWVCESCFSDFQPRFKWTVVEAKD